MKFKIGDLVDIPVSITNNVVSFLPSIVLDINENKRLKAVQYAVVQGGSTVWVGENDLRFTNEIDEIAREITRHIK